MLVTARISDVTARSPDLFRSNLCRREIPSLNGLRGFAALAVVTWHYLDTWHLSYLFPGPFAVTLFFELSGLLITWLLLNELDETGTIHRARFYLRRSLRLFPVFYTVWILSRSVGPFPGSWAYFLYLGDYYTAITHRYSIMTQAWSLGVEEKFYLIWPLILLFCRRRTVLIGSAVVLVAEPIYRILLSKFGFQMYTWFAFDCRLDAIVLGCFMALLARSRWRVPVWLTHPLIAPGALVLVFVFQRATDIIVYLLAALLIATVSRPPRLLNNVLAKFLGAISYSLYLVHPLAREVIWPRVVVFLPNQPIAVILSLQLGLAILSATALHWFVERPFLFLKNQFHTGKASHAG